MPGRSLQHFSNEGLEMEITQENVQEALDESDIEGIRELGAPPDEYTHEARNIASKLAGFSGSELTEGDVVAVVRDVWLKSFGPFSEEELVKRLPVFQQVAHRILSHR